MRRRLLFSRRWEPRPLPTWLLLLAAAAPAFGADAPAPSEFAWRATLELPAGATLARVPLPVDALLRLQSSDARDIRVFNANGEALAFALSRPATGPLAPPPAITSSFPAFGLFSSAAGSAPAPGSVQVRVDEPTGRRTVWVQLDGTARPQAGAPAVTPVQAAIFVTRNEKRPLSAITVQADLPANTPVQVTVAVSTDLAEWSPLALRGRLYRFEGPGAPVNTTLEFEQPQRLEGRYLRLSWYGQDGVRVQAISGIVAQAVVPVARVRAALGAPAQTGTDTLDWGLNFATPLAALVLDAAAPNTLVPVRIEGRMDSAQPWRALGQTVVYRLGAAGAQTTNPPLALNSTPVRQLRVVAANGQALAGASLQLSVEFDPIQVVFLASGVAPFTLAAGRANTPPAALGSATLASVVQGKLDDLPVAGLSGVVQLPYGAEGGWFAALAGRLGGRNMLLWAVLLLGVALLAGVAVALLRQVKGARPDSVDVDKAA